MRTLVFVYGTLKRGHYNNKILGSDAKFISKSLTKESFVLTSCGFPYMYRDSDDVQLPVLGEVWDINIDRLEQLDLLEGVSSKHYNRERIVVHTHNMEPWAYITTKSIGSVYPKCDYMEGYYEY